MNKLVPESDMALIWHPVDHQDANTDRRRKKRKNLRPFVVIPLKPAIQQGQPPEIFRYHQCLTEKVLIKFEMENIGFGTIFPLKEVNTEYSIHPSV
jgi:hypothetical protein